MGTGAARWLSMGRRQAGYSKWVGTVEVTGTVEVPEGLPRGLHRNMGENKGLGHSQGQAPWVRWDVPLLGSLWLAWGPYSQFCHPTPGRRVGN